MRRSGTLEHRGGPSPPRSAPLAQYADGRGRGISTEGAGVSTACYSGDLPQHAGSGEQAAASAALCLRSCRGNERPTGRARPAFGHAPGAHPMTNNRGAFGVAPTFRPHAAGWVGLCPGAAPSRQRPFRSSYFTGAAFVLPRARRCGAEGPPCFVEAGSTPLAGSDGGHGAQVSE